MRLGHASDSLGRWNWIVWIHEIDTSPGKIVKEKIFDQHELLGRRLRSSSRLVEGDDEEEEEEDREGWKMGMYIAKSPPTVSSRDHKPSQESNRFHEGRGTWCISHCLLSNTFRSITSRDRNSDEDWNPCPSFIEVNDFVLCKGNEHRW